MKKTLFFGSTVVDVVIYVDEMPASGEDCNVISQKMQIGGCAFNASEMSRHLSVPYTLLSPVGTGVFGDFVIKEFEKRKIPCFVRMDSVANGCCYNIVERNGERTFLAVHGAEYQFDSSWMDGIVLDDYDDAYVCGLELEEETGKNMVQWLEENFRGKIWFAVSSRIMHVNKDLLRRMLLLKPIMHMNDMEAKLLSSCPTVQEAARWIYARTQNTVIITCNSEGCYIYGREIAEETGAGSEPVGLMMDAYRTIAIDSIGAGDAHIGSLIAFRKQGLSWIESLDKANRIACEVVGVEGATLTDEQFKTIQLKSKGLI